MKEVPDLHFLDGIVAPRILDAARAASKAMTKLGVRHALVGGLAVGAYGYRRATDDVDFIVGPEGFEGTVIISHKPGMPLSINGVVIDTFMDDRDFDPELVEVRNESEDIPIVEPEVLFYLKLKVFRRQDQLDLVELLKFGLHEKPIRLFLAGHAPDLLERFEKIVERADGE